MILVAGASGCQGGRVLWELIMNKEACREACKKVIIECDKAKDLLANFKESVAVSAAESCRLTALACQQVLNDLK